MTVRRILQLGDPLLWQTAQPVSASAPSFAPLVRDLADTLADFRCRTGHGRGIAAPQIGVLERAIFVRVPGALEGALINPVLEWASPERFELWDDCFSFPQLLVRVSRHRRIRFRHLDESGAVRVLEAEGGLSELLQHEMDHLDGILAGRSSCRRRAGRAPMSSRMPGRS